AHSGRRTGEDDALPGEARTRGPAGAAGAIYPGSRAERQHMAENAPAEQCLALCDSERSFWPLLPRPVQLSAAPFFALSADPVRRSPRAASPALPRLVATVSARYPVDSCRTNVCTAASTRAHNARYGQLSDRCNQIRRGLVTTRAATFHSRCRSVLTVAVATSGTAATASRNSTTMA